MATAWSELEIKGMELSIRAATCKMGSVALSNMGVVSDREKGVF